MLCLFDVLSIVGFNDRLPESHESSNLQGLVILPSPGMEKSTRVES